ncbi:MAG: caspase family protein [Gammaproteobacteria bacterium]|nr:caspase family protein [Gammaproteobacteria bacterium]
MKPIKKLVMSILLLALLPAGSVLGQSRGIALESKSVVQATPFVNGVYRALIIGNDRYKDPQQRWPSLETAVSDARSVSGLLHQYYGFSDVEVLENATRREILRALEGLSKRALPNDSVLVYYAGHGFLDAESERGFWVPVDAEGVDSTTFLRNSTIRDELTTIASRAQHTLLISDSCFSGTLLRRGTRGISSENAGQGYFKKVSKKKSVQIISAGGVEYVDDNYRSSGHSPFTYFLLSELENNDRELLTVSELSGNVTRAVANNVDQVPETGVLQGAGDELGEFIFIKLKISVDGVPAEKLKIQVETDTPGTNVVIESEVIDAQASDAETKDSSSVPADPGIVIPLPTL